MKLRRFFSVLCLLLLLVSSASCTVRDIRTDEKTASEAKVPEETGTETVCTLIIRCDTILDHMEDLSDGKEELVPPDGLLLEAENVVFTEGESVFDVLKRELQTRRMHLEFSESPGYDTAYIDGICNLYEYDCGDLSGWVYLVNGERPGYGCSKYILSDGDVIEWLYTCDLGDDL